MRWSPRHAAPLVVLIAAVAVAGGAASPRTGAATPPYLDPAQPVAARVADLLGRMTLAEKIGQMTQVSSNQLRGDPSLVATLDLGSVLSGGNDKPPANTPAAWRSFVHGFEAAALQTRLRIPLLYGFDAVHGANDVVGATIFPQAIGLGATRDAALVERIGRATAEETLGAGVRWTFAPCVCVARNIRWGRAYESFGEDPQLVSRLGSALIRGLQGARLGGAPGSVLATAKHYLGDGDTLGGVNAGDARVSTEQLRRVDLPPYAAAVKAGVGSVMASFSSVAGVPMHASEPLLTGLLKRELGFTGLVVGDWDGINWADGNPGSLTADDVSRSIGAGVDMAMLGADSPVAFQSLLRQAVESGRVSQARIDDAVSRILAVKFRLGLFEHAYAQASYAASVGSAADRALARRAVRESLVLLKNQGHVLPLSKRARILVAGKSADDLGLQSGGWTISWQGGVGTFTRGTTILAGIRKVAPQAKVDYAWDGAGARGHDVAVVVVGEQPYAEGAGDRPAPDALGLDADDLATLAHVRAARVPIVLVVVSGRPLIVTKQLAGVRALVAAWLPGSEGAGVADVLFGDARPTGKLPQSWPATPAQIGVHPGQPGYRPLFRYGFGLTYRG